jgi:NAD(P)-dependent dehydrogenase (short-subunit alcohol dehydrogenase family)
MNPLDLTGRTIIVTGASSGIGRASAVLLSELGARLILVGRNQNRLSETKTLLKGAAHLVEIFDLNHAEDIPSWLKSVAGKTGALNGIVHSAGIQSILPLRITTTEKLDELMRINVTAALGLAKGFRQKEVCASSGSIIFISSIMGLVGQSGQSAYAASKGALISLAKSLAIELARENIRVNCVAPAMVKTEMFDKMMQTLTEDQKRKIADMHPLGFGTPEDVANAIAFLLSDAGRWITGTTLVVDGGYTAH